MHSRHWIALGSLMAAIAVILGAYGAHGLEGHLEKLGHSEEAIELFTTTRWATAVQYHMMHALAMVICGLVIEKRHTRRGQFAGEAFLAGIILFCGLLYVMTFTGNNPSWRWLGMVVPIGGVSFVVGWLALALAGIAKR